jgi:hypothetical protein
MTTPLAAATLAEVSSRAQAALWKSPLFSLRRITVERDHERLKIRGRVATYFQKQQAQEIVRAEAHNIKIINQIEVT